MKRLGIGVVALSAIVPILFLLGNLQVITPTSHLIAIAIAILVFLIFYPITHAQRKKLSASLRTVASRKQFTTIALLIVTLLGIACRLYFYYGYSYEPESDPLVYLEAAKSIASGTGISGDSMVAFFPYLAAYDNLLAAALSVIHDPWLSVILLNTLFDFMGAFILYILIKRLAPSRPTLPFIAFAIWILSPINILFSILSLPIIVVNFFIILSIYVAYVLIGKLVSDNKREVILLSIALGTTLGLGNCFRPIFSIFLIAFVFILFFIFAQKGNPSRNRIYFSGTSFLITFVIFIGIQQMNTFIISNQVSLNIPSKPSGWSIYLGSNWDSSGGWNMVDEARMAIICKHHFAKNDFTGCHKELRDAGLERYESQGLTKNIDLFVKKVAVYTNSQSRVYNVDYTVAGYIGTRTSRIIHTYTVIFIMALFSLSTLFLVFYVREVLLDGSALSPIILFLSLMILGFFFSNLLVESASRYAQVIYPILTLLGVLALRQRGKLNNI